MTIPPDRTGPAGLDASLKPAISALADALRARAAVVQLDHPDVDDTGLAIIAAISYAREAGALDLMLQHAVDEDDAANTANAVGPAGPTKRAASDLSHLTGLAIEITRAASRDGELPALVLDTDPSRFGPITSRCVSADHVRSRCHGAPVIPVGEGLLTGSRTVLGAAVLAHEVAHRELGHPTAPRIIGDSVVGLLGLIAALLIGLPALVPGALSVLLLLLQARRVLKRRREEYAADARAVDLLDRIGLDGRGCLLTLLTEVIGVDPWHLRWADWMVLTQPTAARRIRALEQARRTRPGTGAAPASTPEEGA